MPPVGANQFLQYFDSGNREFPHPRFENAIEMCRLWLDLQSRSDVTQADISQFMVRLTAAGEPGSAWVDLRFQFGAWAQSRGFQVGRKRAEKRRLG